MSRLLADIAPNRQIYYLLDFSSSSEAKVGRGFGWPSESINANGNYELE